MAHITHYEDEVCPRCCGAGWYDIGHVSLAADPRDGETIDPCDQCYGTGMITSPVFADDVTEPTYEDVMGYGWREDWPEDREPY